MPKLPILIVSVLSILMLTGGIFATVLPQGLRREISVPYCEDTPENLITNLRRDDHDGNSDAGREDVGDSTQEDLAAPPCNTNFHCNLGQVCKKGNCVAGCGTNVDCSRFHTCFNGTCQDGRGGLCSPNKNTCSFHADCCSGRCKRWGGLIGRKKCRGSRK
ncbi:hypothetical protein BO94DRAFT_599612 [Aspergillus sclerotioniger CBS 115572]|uniref:WAP domain-containing protein n=1 Tax=Aspergillus sclerotioniger CBS 115572 TaxID=1450535 RepID=A0A317WAB1_9EURO|nr:hypothetical protein BO94DRAFT_599612 [Aspergillus sclerotioniger CBS 115572]PWY83149.1 hypothetical protein BO94DRAFT_599612 [Aspergillus sclerotioniger CBS 115572]